MKSVEDWLKSHSHAKKVSTNDEVGTTFRIKRARASWSIINVKHVVT